MRDDDLNQILSRHDDIVPSSGFVSSVMDAVHRESATPPAIPFPWRRALPGLFAWALMLAAALAVGFRWIADPSGPWTAQALARVAEAAASIGAGWIALALLTTLLSVKLSIRLARAAESR